MIADRLLALLRDRAGYVVTAWSLVRIAVVTVAALVVAGLVIPAHPGDVASAPYNATIATKNTRNVSLPLGDPRGFQPTKHPRAFRVAWIGGSETMGVGRKTHAFIPRLATDRLHRVDGKPVSTDLYYLNAIRLTDELAALGVATRSKPDLVVVSLNPAWVLNDLAAQQWGYLDGTLARSSVWPPSRWPVAASVVSPGDAGWRALSALSPSAIADRFDRGVAMSTKTEKLTFLHAREGAKPPELTGLQALATQRPVDFYFGRYLGDTSKLTLTQAQTAILKRELGSESGLNRAVLQQMFETARRSGIPTYFYLAPINPDLYADPGARAEIEQLRRLLASATAGRTNDLVRFDPEGLQDRVPVTKYEDIVHVLDGAPEAGVIASDLCELLVSEGHDSDCEGR